MLPQFDANDIKYAEQILFGKTEVFDEERITYILDNTTCDLLAVPGSGKTTALLAKLLIIERYLPFRSGGILVISHTNAAVNEIKERIGFHCPKLFSYPNYIGTIQGFVDEFLARPYYEHKYARSIIRIDDEIFRERHYVPEGANGWLRNREGQKEKIVFDSRILGDDILAYPFSNTFPLRDRTSTTYRALFNMKMGIRKAGYLSFNCAYLLGKEYVDKFPRIKTVLQRRFKYIFIDEMQDMEEHQYNLLETLFWDQGASASILQRIGDKNQSIFVTEGNSPGPWQTRPKSLLLSGSQRLSPNVASIVQNLALTPTVVIGLLKKSDGSNVSIKPHLLVYNDNNITETIHKFTTIIREMEMNGLIPVDVKRIYKAIGWTTNAEPNKIRLSSYFPSYTKEATGTKIDNDHLEAYLILSGDSNNSKAISDNILNGFLKVLRLENIKDVNGRFYSKKKLIDFLQASKPIYFKGFKLLLYRSCRGILLGRKNHVLAELRTEMQTFLAQFDGNQTELSRIFIFDNTPTPVNPIPTTVKSNSYFANNIAVEVSTIHATKGQTHTATLYLETFYERSPGGISYESQRLANVLKGGAPSNLNQKLTRQSMKMAYVGFSRPTHLLAFAVHQDRFNSHLHNIDSEIWEIIQV
ncbi:UvrD-helicase domain-containing protein [Chitinophaga sp. sic0106]|uniref:UvrD-helicase domain-containing protein n=1 Tax=Chitinophaga sp. sic0106 TaxID=2854785 RepID=UPI001C48A98B|nr:UvrD-helicase domain-containing protein [Chitinophaga sp. sic0106]MBV7532862.1 UvrD-helicase domain-containing protein [Chitinophaga sp. sic0106]